MKNCLECGSERIVTDVRVIEYNENSARDLQVAVDEQPDAFIFKKRNFSNVKAKVCAECGYIHFFATNPHLLWQAYQNRKKNI